MDRREECPSWYEEGAVEAGEEQALTMPKVVLEEPAFGQGRSFPSEEGKRETTIGAGSGWVLKKWARVLFSGDPIEKEGASLADGITEMLRQSTLKLELFLSVKGRERKVVLIDHQRAPCRGIVGR